MLIPLTTSLMGLLCTNRFNIYSIRMRHWRAFKDDSFERYPGKITILSSDKMHIPKANVSAICFMEKILAGI